MTLIKFLSLVVDTIHQEIGIPGQKRDCLLQKLNYILNSWTVRVKALQSLSGTLNFYSRAKPGGRTFIRHIYNAQGSLPQHWHVSITSDLKKDLRMWVQFLQENDQGSPFLDVLQVPAHDIGFYSDASGALHCGWGCYFRGMWAQGTWGKFLEEHNPSIAWMELYTLTVGVVLWSEWFRTKRILVNCDNTASVHIVNNQTSSCPKAMGLVHLLVHSQLRYQFTLQAQYINHVADALSHFQVQRPGTGCTGTPLSATRLPVSTLRHHMEVLLTVSTTPGTRKVYGSAMKVFHHFLDSWGLHSKNFDEQLLLFATLMSICDKSPCTVATYVSGVRSEFKLLGIMVKNEFLLQRILKGVQNLNHGLRQPRYPVLVQQLPAILAQIGHVTTCYQHKLFSAMALLAFHCLFRVGEITASPLPHNIQENCVEFLT